jgi:hypothetical protein
MWLNGKPRHITFVNNIEHIDPELENHLLGSVVFHTGEDGEDGLLKDFLFYIFNSSTVLGIWYCHPDHPFERHQRRYAWVATLCFLFMIVTVFMPPSDCAAYLRGENLPRPNPMHVHFETWCLPSTNHGPLLGPSYFQKLLVSCIFAVVKYVYAILLERCAFCECLMQCEGPLKTRLDRYGAYALRVFLTIGAFECLIGLNAADGRGLNGKNGVILWLPMLISASILADALTVFNESLMFVWKRWREEGAEEMMRQLAQMDEALASVEDGGGAESDLEAGVVALPMSSAEAAAAAVAATQANGAGGGGKKVMGRNRASSVPAAVNTTAGGPAVRGTMDPEVLEVQEEPHSPIRRFSIATMGMGSSSDEIGRRRSISGSSSSGDSPNRPTGKMVRQASNLVQKVRRESMRAATLPPSRKLSERTLQSKMMKTKERRLSATRLSMHEDINPLSVLAASTPMRRGSNSFRRKSAHEEQPHRSSLDAAGSPKRNSQRASFTKGLVPKFLSGHSRNMTSSVSSLTEPIDTSNAGFSSGRVSPPIDTSNAGFSSGRVSPPTPRPRSSTPTSSSPKVSRSNNPTHSGLTAAKTPLVPAGSKPLRIAASYDL